MNAPERWRRTWTHLGEAPPEGLIDELGAAYAQPHRAYHTGQHLAECFAQLDACPIEPLDRGALELALWFHDAIYDTRAADNEAQSAAWARTALAGLGAERLDRIEALILVTRHEASPGHPDEALLLDVDLSILGAPRERFDEYEAQIRREYEWVPADVYRSTRARILGEFARRPVLYQTPHFRDALEGRARANLERSLVSLAD